MNALDIVNKHNYNEELSDFIIRVYPILVDYFKDEETVYNALMSCPIVISDSVYTAFKEYNFLESMDKNSMVKPETLKIANGAYESKPYISYDKEKKTYKVDKIDRIVAIKKAPLDDEITIGTLVHEICHLIKSYSKEYEISYDVLKQRCGFIEKLYHINSKDGIINKELIVGGETGVGLEEGFNELAEEEITSRLIGKEYESKGYNIMKQYVNELLKIKIPYLKEALLEVQVTHDNTRINQILGDLFYKMIENTDKIYPLEVDMLNFLFSTKIKKAREVSERINEIIDNETNPIIFEGLRNIEKGTMNL